MAQLIGDTLGPYRILERLGVGGMAEVYKAYQPSMDRYVAIKVILQRFAQDATFLQRFQREARAVSRLEHPFILPVHDYGEAEGRPYLVMRYLAAGTLKNRLSGQPMPLRDVNRIIGQVGGALDYAHRTGVIHRDVKPSNVLMDAEGNAYLTDFGLAKMMEASVQLTGTGVGIGTPAYMSPEQGQGETVDSRTDVYSLGVMLYEMVTGRRPYQADTPLAVVYKHVHEPLPLPRSIRPDLPEAVERVILRAMAKDADDRFQRAGAMVRALDVAVRSAEGAEPPRRRARLWLIAALLLLFVVLVAVWRPWAPPKTAAVETVVAEELVAATMAPGTPRSSRAMAVQPTSSPLPPVSPTMVITRAVPTQAPTVLGGLPDSAQSDTGHIPSSGEEMNMVTGSTDVRVDDATNDSYQVYADLAIGTDGTLYAVWEDYRDGTYRIANDIYFAHSTDNGQTWSDNIRVNDGDAANAARRNPHVAVSPTGDVYVVWQDYRNDPNPTDPGSTLEGSQNPDICLAKLPDGGTGFQANVLVYDQGDWQDAPDVEVDGNGNVYVAWYDRTGDVFYGNAVVAKSTDGGTSFGVPVTADNHSMWALTPRLAVNRTNNTIYLVYQGHPRYYKPYFTRSTDGGANWSTDVRLDAGPNREWYDAAREIMVAADAGNHVLVIWADERNDPDNCYTGGSSCHDEFDIHANYSTDGGVTWLTGSNVMVNDDSTYVQIRTPSAAFMSDGTVVAVWRDSRSGDSATDIYMATSSDYGASWSVNQRVDHAPSGFSANNPVVAVDSSNQAYAIWHDNRNGNWDIYSSGIGDTTPPGGDSGQIAFVSDRDGNEEIYVMNADGSGQTRVTHNQAGDDTPSWSPDGQRIAFVLIRDGNWEIYVMSPDGSGQTRLTNNESHDYGPSWSPDGQRIAFCSYRDGNAEIYVMKADGSGQTRLTHDEAHDWYPSWSPDGPRIAFASERDGNAEIYLMNADGSGQIRLSHNQVDDWVPDWSPDGQRIAFDSERDGNYEVYVMKADGSRQIRLTHNEVADFGPDWSPDGQRIAFCSRRDGNEEIYVMSADGSGQTRLTDNQALDRDPSWRP